MKKCAYFSFLIMTYLTTSIGTIFMRKEFDNYSLFRNLILISSSLNNFSQLTKNRFATYQWVMTHTLESLVLD